MGEGLLLSRGSGVLDPRKALSGLGVVLVACALPLGIWLKSGEFYLVVYALAGLSLATFPMARSVNVLARIVARAVWAQAFVLGSLMALMLAGDVWDLYAAHGVIELHSNRHLVPTSMMYMVGSALAWGFSRAPTSEFAPELPQALRGHFVAALTLALADTVALSLYTGMELSGWISGSGAWQDVVMFAVSAVVMLFASVGLSRRAVWGLFVNSVANVVIAALALHGVFELPMVLSMGLVATAVVQSVLLSPLLRGVLSTR